MHKNQEYGQEFIYHIIIQKKQNGLYQDLEVQLVMKDGIQFLLKEEKILENIGYYCLLIKENLIQEFMKILKIILKN